MIAEQVPYKNDPVIVEITEDRLPQVIAYLQECVLVLKDKV